MALQLSVKLDDELEGYLKDIQKIYKDNLNINLNYSDIIRSSISIYLKFSRDFDFKEGDVNKE